MKKIFLKTIDIFACNPDEATKAVINEYLNKNIDRIYYTCDIVDVLREFYKDDYVKPVELMRALRTMINELEDYRAKNDVIKSLYHKLDISKE